jgi:hypothetical protein
MTKVERQQVSNLLRATECLLHENIALKLVLEHRQVHNWCKLLDHLLADREILAGVRLRFKEVHREVELGGNSADALHTLVGSLPSRRTN